MPGPIVVAPVALAPWATKLIVAGGAAALAALWRARRARSSGTRDAALDEIGDGVALLTEPRDGGRQATLETRATRVVRIGRNGPGIEVDVAAVVRGRVRPIPAQSRPARK